MGQPSRPHFVLASASPRRKQLLEEAGFAFEVIPSEIPEPEPPPGTDPAWYVADLAWKKARQVALRLGSGLVLAADTACSVEGQILNKPVDRDDARRMIRLQEGRDTEVLTGVCLYDAAAHHWLGAIEVSVCRFQSLDDPTREQFLDTNRWQGKAGAYGVQDRDPFVRVVSGSWSNVVGLPMERLDELFRRWSRMTAAS